MGFRFLKGIATKGLPRLLWSQDKGAVPPLVPLEHERQMNEPISERS
jgi:hypothetical protein